MIRRKRLTNVDKDALVPGAWMSAVRLQFPATVEVELDGHGFGARTSIIRSRYQETVDDLGRASRIQLHVVKRVRRASV
jgi:hypothetical protein